MTNNCNGLSHLSVTPVKFGDFDIVTPSDGQASTNHKFPCYTQQVLCYSWAVYSFGGGHFASTISSRSLPFCIKPACNQYDFGCSSSGNLQHACRSLKMAKISAIISAPLAIVLKYMATSSILFAYGTVTQLHISGSSKRQSLLNFVQFSPFRWLLLSSSLITTADASKHSQSPSNQLAGVCPQPTPPSRPMATLSQAHAVSSLASILRAHQWSNRFSSNHLHHLSHAPLAYQFGSHSIVQIILCC
jgi:hypothetical protein